VIRGQTAPRVKVLSDGAALMDASEVSPDHAVSGEPLLLDRIEILRGPSALLYGGGAIGGR
jgi:iron complex outermembrane receptor protein